MIRRVLACSPWVFVTVFVVACGFPHEMERAAPLTGTCPAEGLQRVADVPTDTTQLHWYRAIEERDRRLAARWCATVGSPEFRLEPTVSFPEWGVGQSLEVVSWNTFLGGGDLYRFLRDELGLDCTTQRPALEEGARPFVLLLQEVWRRDPSLPFVESSSIVPWTTDHGRPNADGPSIIAVAERCGLSFVYVPSARNGPDSGTRPSVDKGNAVLSTLLLSAPIALDLPIEGGRKVAVAATVRAPQGERVRLVSVHLDVASTLVRTLITGNQTRARQASGVIDGLRKAERDGPSTAATVVGADLNTWVGNETTLRLMWDAFPDSPAWDQLATALAGLPPDHMFFRSESSVPLTVESYGRIDDRYGSDHHGRRLRLIHTPVRPGN